MARGKRPSGRRGRTDRLACVTEGHVLVRRQVPVRALIQWAQAHQSVRPGGRESHDPPAAQLLKVAVEGWQARIAAIVGK